MKGKFFFIENGREIEIQEFDYDYVLNSLLANYKWSGTNTYTYNVIVSRTYDSLGNPHYDTRNLPLNQIYFNNRNLSIFDIMRDEIHFKKLTIRNLPLPPLEKEYREWKEGRIVRKKVDNTQVAVPAPVVLQKKKLDPADPRLADIDSWINYPDSVKPDSTKVLDWFVNLPVCAQEVGTKIQKLSERQMDLNSALHQHSDYIRLLMNNLTTALEKLFPLKPSFTQKLFGKTDIKVSSDDLPKVMKALNEAVKYDTNKFSGLEKLFDEIKTEAASVKEELEYGKLGCEYALRRVDDPFEYELTQERIMKMSIISSMTETSILTDSKQYQIDMNRMIDIQTTTIPLIIMRLRSQLGKAVDENTADIIRNLAYGNKE